MFHDSSFTGKLKKFLQWERFFNDINSLHYHVIARLFDFFMYSCADTLFNKQIFIFYELQTNTLVLNTNRATDESNYR